MSVFLKPVQRTNPSDPDAPKKWYPVQDNEGTTENPLGSASATRPPKLPDPLP